MPRMLMSTGNETMEEASMRLFPNLGRSSRPDTISFNEYQISECDFCRLVDIPFDVLVRVPATAHANQCSCSLFYLYRVVRRARPEWLVTLPLPACYRDLLAEPRLVDEAERACEFAENVRKCREERGGEWLSYSDSTLTATGQCRAEQFDYYRENTFVGAKKSTTSASSVDNDADDDIDDDNDSGWNSNSSNDVDDDDEAEILEDNSIAKQPVSASIEYDENNDDESGAASNNNNMDQKYLDLVFFFSSKWFIN